MDSIRVIQHNVLHWPTNRRTLTTIYHTISPDVILINSHGVRDNDSLKIYGYTVHKRNASGENDDGSAIAIKHGLTYKLDDDYVTDMLSITLQTTTGPLKLATTYIPPRRPFLSFPDFHKLLYDQDPVYILGDLNAKHHALGDNHNNTVGRNLMTYINAGTALHTGPNFPTFIRHNCATSPDIIITNNRAHHHTFSQPGPLTPSDHIPIILTISTSPIRIPTARRPNYRQADWELFRRISDASLPDTPTLDNQTLEHIDAALEQWLNAVEEGTKAAIPTTSMRFIRAQTPSPELHALQTRYTRLYNLAGRQGLTFDQYQEYRQLQRDIQTLCRQLYNDQWNLKISQLTDKYRDPTRFWREIRLLKGTDKRSTPYLIDHQGRKVHDTQGQLSLFTNLWRDIFQISDDENEDFDEDNERTVLHFLDDNRDRILPHDTADYSRLTNNPLTRRITVDELKTVVTKMKSTAPGLTGINKQVIMECSQSMIERLIDIFNASLSAGYFPDKFKEAVLVMIPKPGKTDTTPENYRPVSLLEVPGKLLEKIINRRLRLHLESNGLHNPRQYGFRPQKDTTKAIALIYETIAQSLSRREQCCLVLRDVSKAFDKVWHEGLKFKLLHLGLPTILEKLLCDFVTDRTARIRHKDKLGDLIHLDSGVAQGSVLSPTLYILYTRDTPPPPPDCLDIMYADDVTQVVTHQGRSKLMMANKIAREIARISQYERQWKIRTNQQKFKIIPLAQKYTEDIIVDGDLLNTNNGGNILGLTITRAGITKHVTEITGKGKSALSSLYRFKMLNSKIKSHLVKSYILPLLEYPPVPLNTISNTQKLKLQRVLNKALRYAENEHYPFNYNTEQLHNIHKITALNTRIHRRATKIWQKLEETRDQNYAKITNQEYGRMHNWFPSSLLHINRPPPNPIYTSF